jgi:hypothetical protein
MTFVTIDNGHIFEIPIMFLTSTEGTIRLLYNLTKVNIGEKHMNKILTFFLVLPMCLTFAACGENNSKSDVESSQNISQFADNNTGSSEVGEEIITKQIQLIVDNVSLWRSDGENELYSYAVTDMDNNGRLEIISSSCQGTGFYTYSDVWEVNEGLDGLTLCKQERMEGESQADIIVQSVPVYYDAGGNIYYYVFDDLIKNGAAEYYENKRAITLRNGQFTESFLAYKTTVFTDSNLTVTYTDADETPISEEEYNGIADKVFADMEKKQANIQWITDESAQLQSIGETKMFKMLEESYRGFYVS